MIEIVLAYDYMDAFLTLVKEYTDAISEEGDEVQATLSSQNLEDELQDTQKKYGLPHGRMYLALVDGKAAGCVALTKNDEDHCEIKRLYVRPQFRGQHISRKLTQRVIEDAKFIGYRYMRLDTFPFMRSAIRLYEKMGFEYVARYNDNPADSAIFMQLTL